MSSNQNLIITTPTPTTTTTTTTTTNTTTSSTTTLNNNNNNNNNQNNNNQDSSNSTIEQEINQILEEQDHHHHHQQNIELDQEQNNEHDHQTTFSILNSINQLQHQHQPDLLLHLAQAEAQLQTQTHSSTSSDHLQFPSTSLASSIQELHSSLLTNSNDPNLDPFLASLQQLTSSTTSPALITPAPIDSSLSLTNSNPSNPSLEIPTSEAEVHSQLFSLDFDHSSVLDDHQLQSLLFPDDNSTDPQPPTQSTDSLPDPAFHPSILLSIPSQSPPATRPSEEFSSNLDDSLKNATSDTLPSSISQSAPLLEASDSRPQEILPSASSSTKHIKLPKAKLTQCNQLREAAEKALESVWEILVPNLLETELGLDPTSPQELKITRGLDRQFGELHALSAPFKLEDLALIWPQCMSNKVLKQSYNSPPSPAYFAIRKANIAFVAEYILYAMPGEEAYGKNDIVFACEGFLPLVLDRGLVQDEESWKLFNELKVQIYIQRLDQGGAEEADTRVLPNLFVETLSSYSGVEIEATVEAAFEAFAIQTKAELVAAEADLDKLREAHPYIPFAISALKLLRRCQQILEEEQAEWNDRHPTPSMEIPQIVGLAQEDISPILSKRKRKRKSTARSHSKHSEIEEGREMYDLMGDHPIQEQEEGHMGYTDAEHGLHHDDINVGHHSRDDEYDQDGDPEAKGRYNPYRLGRGKGPAAAPRRRWTQEEYELLLEEVRLHSNKYDCMAQIIKRHGKNGEISDVLKDQNNVSLKDKARNLTMEWSRHGYPEDKPWLKEAFARFAVKPRSNGQSHHGRRIGIEEEMMMEEAEAEEGEMEQQQEGLMGLDPVVLMNDDELNGIVKQKKKRRRRKEWDGLDDEILVNETGNENGNGVVHEVQHRLELELGGEEMFDPELLGNPLDLSINQNHHRNGNRNDLLVIPMPVSVSVGVQEDVPVDPSLTCN